MNPPDVRVFVTDINEVFSSPNADFLPPVPGRTDRFTHDVHDPCHASKVRWHSLLSPQLAYIARHPSFNTPLLKHLTCTYRNVPVVHDGGWYFLDPEVQNKWLQLENSLLWVANVMLTAGRANLPLGWEPEPVPSSCGYRNRHLKEVFARRCAMKSRDVFVPLMALCSWSISLVGDRQTARNLPLWVDYLFKEDPLLPPSCIEDLTHSTIADFKIPRFGCFMDVVTGDSDAKRYIRAMLNADVPIWFFWGTSSNAIRNFDHDLEIYRPQGHQIDYILKTRPSPEPRQPLLHPYSVAALSAIHSRDSSRRLSIDIAPRVNLPKGSKQKPGEGWKAFFDRMRMKYLELESKESTSQKERRLAREKHSKTGEAPGKRGAVVFYWEKDDNGFRFRRQVSRADVEDIWEEYVPSQKRYDGFADEWDICTDFQPDAVHSDDDMSDVGTPPPPQIVEASLASSVLRLPPQPVDRSVWNEVDFSYEPELSSGATRLGPSDSIVDISCHRYGLVPGSTYNSLSTVDWDSTARSFGCDVPALIHPVAKQAIQALVGSLIEVAKNEVRHPPKTIWDLDPLGSGYLFNKSNFIISLRVEDTSIGKVCWLDSQNLHPSRNASWSIIVQDPATALECLRRRWGPHQVDIAFELCSRGIPFRTCIVANRSIVLDRPVVLGLGYRLSGYVPSKRDYATYESIRNKFLESPRARATLLKGGIIWRLAKDVVPESMVLSGPSSEIYTTGQEIHCNSGIFVDDELNEDELNLISGVYKVFTGKGKQDSHLSWWPKHSAWAKSGLDIGFWSNSCEKWFQLRLERIRAGNANLRSGQEWTQAITRLEMNAKRVSGANKALATKALDNMMDK